MWIASLALGKPLNIIFESVVWSTAGDEFDHTYPLLLLTSHEEVILCEQELQEDVQDLSHLGVAVPPQASRRRGCPAASIPEYQCQPDLDHTNTDPEELLEVQNMASVRMPIPHAGTAIPQVCPVHALNVSSGIALYHHLKAQHPNDHPYTCNDCNNSYNNLKELSSH